jgi:SAM-dependent methyltransferase
MKSFHTYASPHGVKIDDPKTTWARRSIIQENMFLKLIYDEWYSHIINALPIGEKSIVEIGTGAGFLNELIPKLITSEIIYCPFVNIVLNGLHLPFVSDSLRAVVLVDVLHHIPDPIQFFNEATRCIETGGKIVMIEPWVSPWSTFIYKHFHYEPYQPASDEWGFTSTGPLSGANIALPWIVFQRDQLKFNQRFPQWRIDQIRGMMPFRYLLSGGVSQRSLMPAWTFSFWRRVEFYLSPVIDKLAMFAMIQLVKVS